MKLLLVASLLLYSCGPSEIQSGSLDLIRYTDKDHGVICYRVNTVEGLSCLQINTSKAESKDKTLTYRGNLNTTTCYVVIDSSGIPTCQINTVGK
jgi:hypothetical protein